MLNEDEARALIAKDMVSLVRGRANRTRRVVLRADVAMPMTAAARRQALDSYRGIDKYTYHERFENAASCHMLKRYNPHTGGFVVWSSN